MANSKSKHTRMKHRFRLKAKQREKRRKASLKAANPSPAAQQG